MPIGKKPPIQRFEELGPINKLETFINAVGAQRGKQLTDQQADTLIAKAQEIIDHIQQP